MGRRFEEFEVWKLSLDLVKILSEIFYDKEFKNYSFQDQIMRAAISVTNNIAEWNERWSNADFVKFLYYAKGSIWEVRSMLYVANYLWYINEKTFDELRDKCITVSVQIHNFIKSMKK